MSVEVEVKVTVADPDHVRAMLAQRVDGVECVYEDTYYDWPDHRLTTTGRQELRVRVIRAAAQTRARLTFKGAMLDATSTPEYETTVQDPAAMDAILAGLGLEHLIAYSKHCTNYRFVHRGADVLATLVHVQEIDRWFLEVETVVPDGTPTGPGRDIIWDVLHDLGMTPDDEEPTFYIDLVTMYRASPH